MGKLQTSGFGRTRSRHTVASGPTMSEAILALAPVGYWKLDESAGGTANDSSGNSRNGGYGGTAGVGYTLAGVAGPDKSYVNLGISAGGFIQIADNNAWSIGNAPGMTVFALVKPNSVAGTTRQIIAAKGSSSNYEYTMGANGVVAGRWEADYHNAAGANIAGEFTNGVMGTAWQAVAVAFNNANYNDRFAIYRNSGTALTSTQPSLTNSTYANGAANLVLGWRDDVPASQYWQGGMAHVAFFAGALNSTQVGGLMAAAQRGGWF